ncbi:hypothetical protein PF003_g9216 [Phytophthora fragariae]|nr:hypothetical protein PF003_g9216 [Phytophthora fragariae]
MISPYEVLSVVNERTVVKPSVEQLPATIVALKVRATSSYGPTVSSTNVCMSSAHVSTVVSVELLMHLENSSRASISPS